VCVCIDGQLGYYDYNCLCQSGLICVGERRDDRVCQEDSRSSMPTISAQSPKPTATNIPTPTITFGTSTTMPTISVPITAQPPNPDHVASNNSSPPPTTSGVYSTMPNSPITLNPSSPKPDPDPGLDCNLIDCAGGSASPSISTYPSESTFPSIYPSTLQRS